MFMSLRYTESQLVLVIHAKSFNLAIEKKKVNFIPTPLWGKECSEKKEKSVGVDEDE